MTVQQTPPWRFDPWNLGYDVTLGGLKLLVVAESHYREERDENSFKRDETQAVVRLHGIGLDTSTARSPLFRTVARLLETDDTKGGDVWQNIYYCNYFQRVMEDPSDPPTEGDFASGVEPFDAVLRAIRPDAILVVSARLWKDMKNETVAASSCALGRIYDFTASAGLRIPGAHTHHPSKRRKFDVGEWRERVSDYLRYVRERSDLNG